MKNYNEELAQAFNEIGDLLSILGENPFRIIAYRRTGRRLKEEFRPLTKKDAKKEILKQIPGVGEALSAKIIQYIKEGKIDQLDQLRKKIPQAVRDLLAIPHLGPKRVRQLYINLGIKSKEDLIRAADSGEIENLPGFGQNLVRQITDALKRGQEKKRRHPRAEVEPVAQKLVDLLKSIKGVKKAEAAGSYRRKSPDVGDLDILVCGEPVAKKAEKAIFKLYPDATSLASGETKVAFVLFPENLQVDIRFVPEESYGAALLYFTGSKEFNVRMRKAAIEKGYLLNEYGLFKDGEWVAGKTEKEVFEKLGFPVTAPSKRK